MQCTRYTASRPLHTRPAARKRKNETTLIPFFLWVSPHLFFPALVPSVLFTHTCCFSSGWEEGRHGIQAQGRRSLRRLGGRRVQFAPPPGEKNGHVVHPPTRYKIKTKNAPFCQTLSGTNHQYHHGHSSQHGQQQQQDGGGGSSEYTKINYSSDDGRPARLFRMARMCKLMPFTRIVFTCVSVWKHCFNWQKWRSDWLIWAVYTVQCTTVYVICTSLILYAQWVRTFFNCLTRTKRSGWGKFCVLYNNGCVWRSTRTLYMHIVESCYVQSTSIPLCM